MRSTTRFALVTTLVLLFGVAVPASALFDGTLTASPCLAGKVKCVAKTKSCLLMCHRKALLTGTAVDAGCLAKCRNRFAPANAGPGEGCFAKLEAKGGCGASVGDFATFAAAIDAHVQEIAAQLVPAGGTPFNKCTGGKVGCVRKYNACILNLVRKAAQDGAPIGDVSKCTKILDGCVGRLEARYCDPASIGCSSTAPPCLTLNDQSALRIQDDAFVDEVVHALSTGPSDVNTQRCSGDTSVPCTSAPGGVAGCGGGLGTCEFYLGAPLPVPVGGLTVCVTNQWNGAITGTFEQSSGVSAGAAALVTRIYTFIAIEHPCPRCMGDGFLNDGVSTGTCQSGARNGLSCDGNGASPEPSFGVTSLDCPPVPGGLVATVSVDLATTNDGAIAKTIVPGSPTCNGAPGKLCLCGSCSLDSTRACENDLQCASAGAGTCTNSFGEPRRPSACNDDTSSPGDGTICSPVGGGEGECLEGPFSTHCLIETFRGCLTDVDCPASNDRCVGAPGECFPGYNGNIGDAVTALGSHDPPRNGSAVSAFASVFCVPPTPSVLVNLLFSLPGPARTQLLGVNDDDGGPACPTRASFLPTSKSGVIDLGWNGFAHDAKMIGQSKITVATTCTGTHPSCSCTYTGPIANPNVP